MMMNRTLQTAGIALLGIMMACGAYAQESETTEKEEMMQLPSMQLHDPFILAHKESKTYYLYTSNIGFLSGTRGVGTMAYTSKDLKNWTKPKAVFIVPDDAFANQGGWAPEVHEYKGKYYLFTTIHDESQKLSSPPQSFKEQYVRGSIIAVSDSPAGPFKMMNKEAPVVDKKLMTLDGTLFVDEENQPWMVYAHEWIQKIDGTIEAVKLDPEDLSKTIDEPIHLFKASDAPWLNATITPYENDLHYVTDGPQFLYTTDGSLVMLWSSYESGSYVQTIARSKTGKLQGPWEQLDPLLKYDSGHGMFFKSFDDQLMMVVHRPFNNARGKLYEMKDAGDHIELVRQRIDLDGDPKEYK